MIRFYWSSPLSPDIPCQVSTHTVCLNRSSQPHMSTSAPGRSSRRVTALHPTPQTALHVWGGDGRSGPAAGGSLLESQGKHFCLWDFCDLLGTSLNPLSLLEALGRPWRSCWDQTPPVYPERVTFTGAAFRAAGARGVVIMEE